jgi:hypothetical protein
MRTKVFRLLILAAYTNSYYSEHNFDKFSSLSARHYVLSRHSQENNDPLSSTKKFFAVLFSRKFSQPLKLNWQRSASLPRMYMLWKNSFSRQLQQTHTFQVLFKSRFVPAWLNSQGVPPFSLWLNRKHETDSIDNMNSRIFYNWPTDIMSDAYACRLFITRPVLADTLTTHNSIENTYYLI